MNADHADAIGLYATQLLGMPEGHWRATGCDPDGMDLRAGALRARLAFPQKVRNGGELRKMLVAFAAQARRI
jgi:putative heme iron utilization protein